MDSEETKSTTSSWTHVISTRSRSNSTASFASWADVVKAGDDEATTWTEIASDFNCGLSISSHECDDTSSSSHGKELPGAAVDATYESCYIAHKKRWAKQYGGKTVRRGYGSKRPVGYLFGEKPKEAHGRATVERYFGASRHEESPFALGTGHVMYSCNKKGRWNLANILEEDNETQAVNEQMMPRVKSSGWERKKYTVPLIDVKGLQKPTQVDKDLAVYFEETFRKKNRAQEAANQMEIYIVYPHKKKKLHGTYSYTLPEQILQNPSWGELKARYHAPKGTGMFCLPQKASSTCFAPNCFFSASHNKVDYEGPAHQFLEIDFGCTRRLDCVTFAARIPPVEKRRVKKNTPMVLSFRNSRDFMREHFYKSVQVFCRQDGERTWISLGTFRGPSTNFDVRAHSFQSPVVCRYIRVVPILQKQDEHRQSRGLRCAFFGDLQAKENQSTPHHQASTSVNHSQAAGGGDDDDMRSASFWILQNDKICSRSLCYDQFGCRASCQFCRSWKTTNRTRKKETYQKEIKDVYL